MGKCLLGRDALLREIGQHLQQQVQEIDAIRNTPEVVFEIDPLETAEGVEETGIEGHSLFVLLLLLGRQRTQHPEDGEELIAFRLALEDGSEEEELSHDAPCCPNIDGGGVLGEAEYEFRGTVVPRDDVGSVLAIGVNHLAAAEITDLDHSILGKKDILRLQVPVGDALGMYVAQSVQQLVYVTLNRGKGTLIDFSGSACLTLRVRSIRLSRLSSTYSKTIF